MNVSGNIDEVDFGEKDLETDCATDLPSHPFDTDHLRTSGREGKDLDDVDSAVGCSKKGCGDNTVVMKLISEMKDEIVTRDIFFLTEDTGWCLFDMSSLKSHLLLIIIIIFVYCRKEMLNNNEHCLELTE